MFSWRLGTHTWFRSISETADITSFGSNNPGKCNCAVGGSVCGLGARRDISCNCDADDFTDRVQSCRFFQYFNCSIYKFELQVDDGYFSGKDFVGITNLTFVNRAITGSGLVTLGPLECSGKVGIERTVSFKSHAGSLSIGTLANNEDISFFFRTTLKSAVLLYQPSVAGSDSLRIALINGTYHYQSESLDRLAINWPKLYILASKLFQQSFLFYLLNFSFKLLLFSLSICAKVNAGLSDRENQQAR